MSTHSHRRHGRHRAGFTLIELLIVVVIIGVLAAIALPKFGQTRERAVLSGMRADLRNLQSAMELYYHNNNLSYVGATIGAGTLGFTPTAGNDLVLTTEATGWTAIVRHPGASEACAVFVGTAEPLAPATQVSVMACAPE
jgi:type IV pilus assembly protein PilA